MNKPKTHAEKLAYLKNWMAIHKLTVTFDALAPEWFAVKALRIREDEFIRFVLLDDSPLKPIYKAGARFYRLDDLAEFLEFPK